MKQKLHPFVLFQSVEKAVPLRMAHYGALFKGKDDIAVAAAALADLTSVNVVRHILLRILFGFVNYHAGVAVFQLLSRTGALTVQSGRALHRGLA